MFNELSRVLTPLNKKQTPIMLCTNCTETETRYCVFVKPIQSFKPIHSVDVVSRHVVKLVWIVSED